MLFHGLMEKETGLAGVLVILITNICQAIFIAKIFQNNTKVPYTNPHSNGKISK